MNITRQHFSSTRDTSKTRESPQIMKKFTLRLQNPPKNKDSLDIIHPSFHVNSVIPSKVHKLNLDDSKIFKTHDPRELSHLNIYGMDYSFIPPSFTSIKHCLERGYYEYIDRKKARIVMDIDLLRKLKQLDNQELTRKSKLKSSISPNPNLTIYSHPHTRTKAPIRLLNKRKSLE